MNRIHLVALSTVLAIAGCADTQFAREQKSAEKQIDVAKEEGATSDALEAARGSLKFAKESEARATDDLKTGREELRRANDQQSAAIATSKEKHGAAEGADAKLASAERDVASCNARQADLRAKGLSESDVSAASGVEAARARQRVVSMKAARDTVQLEIPLADLECEAAHTAVKAAETKISSAEQRLNVARSLYARSEQQARGVEMDALAGKRSAIDTRLGKD